MNRAVAAKSEEEGFRSIRRLAVGLAVALLLAVFVVWRIEGERMERMRTALIDRLMPAVEIATLPAAWVTELVDAVDEYIAMAEQLDQLVAEVQQLHAWRERAILLEQQNVELRELLNTRDSEADFHISAEVLADTSSQFRHSVIVNVGTENGVRDGWPVMDKAGLVGRISGIGRRTARVILLSDISSRIPVKLQSSGQRGIVIGDNSHSPPVEFLVAGSSVPGLRVVTSGDGGVFPPNLLVGRLTTGSDGKARVRLAAELWQLEYVSVVRQEGIEALPEEGALILPRISRPTVVARE